MNNTYWNNNGKYQEEYNKLWSEYVPSIGYTDNKYINSLIAISKWYHDLYNNGLGNEDVLLQEIKENIEPIQEELKLEDNIIFNVLRSRITIEEYEEPVYIYDEKNECETDEIDYYDTREEEVQEEIIEKDYKDFEILCDSIIKLCVEKLK